jgi:Tfp pilus assembly protein PilW
MQQHQLNRIANPNGVTLIDTLAALAIGCICLVIAATLLTHIHLAYNRAEQQTQLIDQIDLASYQVAEQLHAATQIDLLTTCPKETDTSNGFSYICVQQGDLVVLDPAANGKYRSVKLANQHPLTFDIQATEPSANSLEVTLTGHTKLGQERVVKFQVSPINLQRDVNATTTTNTAIRLLSK